MDTCGFDSHLGYMLELHSEDSYEITGRGTSYSFKGPLPACCPKDLIEQHVIVDGASWTVKGVEVFAVAYGHDQPYPQSFNYGLLLEPWTYGFKAQYIEGTNKLRKYHGSDANIQSEG